MHHLNVALPRGIDQSPYRQRIRHADEHVAVRERGKLTWDLALQVRARMAALGLTRVGLIRKSLGASEGEVLDARAEYRLGRVLKGVALPDEVELKSIAEALDTTVGALLDGVCPSRLELLRLVGPSMRLQAACGATDQRSGETGMENLLASGDVTAFPCDGRCARGCGAPRQALAPAEKARRLAAQRP